MKLALLRFFAALIVAAIAVSSIYTDIGVQRAAAEQAKIEAFYKVEKLLPQGIQVIDKKIEYQTINDGKTISAKAIYECIEEIGEKQPIARE